MLVVLVLLLIVIRDYLVSLLLAMIFAGLLLPFYKRLLSRFKGRTSLSAIMVLVLFLLVIIIPLAIFAVQVVNQAAQVSTSVFEFIDQNMSRSGDPEWLIPKWLPYADKLLPYAQDIQDKIMSAMGDFVSIVVGGLGSATQKTFVFFIHLFVMCYGIYYFLIHGEKMVNNAHRYLPMTYEEVDMLVQNGLSISRATLKGALLIGAIQGALVGLGLWVTGIDGPIFWAAISMVLSILPSVGSALVYVPAGIYLIATGQTGAGIGLLIWGFGVVGTIDNFLRPYLVGKDTKISDLMILVSTLGGIGIFGLSGFVIGPVIVGLFMTISKIYIDAQKN